MIDFPCSCGNLLSLPEDQAGGSLQCPKCGLLVSVPTLDDLRLLDRDGTYTLDAAPTEKQRRALEKIRPEESSLDMNAVVEAIPLDADPTAAPVTPRYDPFTGELIRAISVEAHIQSVAAKAPPRTQPISKLKDRGKTAPAIPHSWLVLLGEMFMAANITVLLLMTVFHVILAFGIFWAFGIKAFMFVFVPAAVMVVCLGYFSIIVQETGPGEKDELPRPLREFEFKSDVFDPFLHFCIPLAVCLLPGALVEGEMAGSPAGRWIGGGLVILGAILFPAMFMTAAADGVIANFRPDRVVGVIIKAGFSYIPVPLAWALGMTLVMNGMAAIFNTGISMFATFKDDEQMHTMPTWNANNWMVGIVFIFVGLYFSYYACWQLAMIWRKHHRDFPWVAQRFRPEPAPPPKSPKRPGHKPA